MITLEYLNQLLPNHGYIRSEEDAFPIFWKKIQHKNHRDKYAFTLIIITLDTYTVTIEGMNEMLIRRAVDAGAIEIPDLETLDLLRDVVYDGTIDTSTKSFETIFNFFETQLTALQTEPTESDAHEAALVNINLLVDAANSASIDDE
jgi:hypothetical protein